MDLYDSMVRLRLSDVKQISESDLRFPQISFYGDIKAFFRNLQLLCERSVWVTIRSDQEVNTVTSVCAFQPIDARSRRYQLHLFPSQDAFDQQVLDHIVNKAVNDLDIFRLETDVAPGDNLMHKLLRDAGWRHEGLLQSAYYCERLFQYEDRHRYVFFRPEQKEVCIALVPFTTAVLAITGRKDVILSADFIRYGEPADQLRIQEFLSWLHLNDQNGCLLDRKELLQRSGDTGYFTIEGAPSVLHQAATQAQAYFNGEREPFDLPLLIDGGSAFQQSVWKELQHIPYGTTLTYEAVAAAISQGDQAEAKKKARAVGAACSANPLPVFIPCHRVIGKDGKLVGFSGGLDIKEYLLAHEIMGV
ncbi:MAG: methylated-DNA--[protein]-cysteine S-methyltransferase [Clostridiaceae bacterium]|nr:methylated-DNA--[protein]-cysteine S-methyltransferase [Clostridiaceae bacterium]